MSKQTRPIKALLLAAILLAPALSDAGSGSGGGHGTGGHGGSGHGGSGHGGSGWHGGGHHHGWGGWAPYYWGYDGWSPYNYGGGDSYTAPPAVTTDPKQLAHLTVNVPAGAEVWVNLKPVGAEGPVREFDLPIGPKGRQTLSIRARWREDGRRVMQTQKVELIKNSDAVVQFPVPEATAPRSAKAKRPGKS